MPRSPCSRLTIVSNPFRAAPGGRDPFHPEARYADPLAHSQIFLDLGPGRLESGSLPPSVSPTDGGVRLLRLVVCPRWRTLHPADAVILRRESSRETRARARPCDRSLMTRGIQEQSLSYLRHRHRSLSVLPLPGFWSARQEFQEVRGRYLLGPA